LKRGGKKKKKKKKKKSSVRRNHRGNRFQVEKRAIVFEMSKLPRTKRCIIGGVGAQRKKSTKKLKEIMNGKGSGKKENM